MFYCLGLYIMVVQLFKAPTFREISSPAGNGCKSNKLIGQKW